MALTGKRICITGGAGFIGSYLVQRLIEDNEVVVYDNLHRNAMQFAHVDGHPHLHFIKGDVMDYDATPQGDRGLPGGDPLRRDRRRLLRRSQRRDDDGSEHARHAPGGQGRAGRRGRAVRRVLDQRGLRAVHPQGQGRRPDDDRPDRREPLGLRGQQAGVRAPVVRALQGGRPAAGDRPAVQRLRSAAGRRRRDPRHDRCRRCSNPPITLYNDGTQIRAWCYVEDFVDGVLRCAEQPDGDRPRVQSRQPAGHDHQLRARQHDHPAHQLEVGRSCSSRTRARKSICACRRSRRPTTLLGFRPTVSLEAGISRTIPWYAEHMAR